MSNKGMLWWAVDQESGSFAPLPAGPMLIPAVIIYGLIRLFGGNGQPRYYAPSELLPPRILHSAEYRRDASRYRYLKDKEARFGISDLEALELHSLTHPAWYRGLPFRY